MQGVSAQVTIVQNDLPVASSNDDVTTLLRTLVDPGLQRTRCVVVKTGQLSGELLRTRKVSILLACSLDEKPSK